MSKFESYLEKYEQCLRSKLFRVEWGKAHTSKLQDGMTLYSHPLPGSGILLTFMLNILSGYKLKDNDHLTVHRLIESFKYGYARRSNLGDPTFVPGIEEVLIL